MLNTNKQQISFVLLGVALSAFSLVSIILFTDPFGAGTVTFLFFYLSLFLLTLCAFTFAGLLVRLWFWRGVYMVHLANSFRQAILVSVFITACLILQAHNLLSWWVGGSLILFLACLEIFLNLKV